MNKIIVIYSKTGNTLGVAKKIQETGSFDLKEVKAKSDDPNIPNPELINIPDVVGYDYVVFASPVHAFSLSRIMNAYLSQLPDLSGKTIDLFITHLFPFAWMGGNHTLKQMKKLVESKNGAVRHMTSINWKSKNRESTIDQMIKIYTDEKTI